MLGSQWQKDIVGPSFSVLRRDDNMKPLLGYLDLLTESSRLNH